MSIKSFSYRILLVVCLFFGSALQAASPSLSSFHDPLVDAADRGDITEVRRLIRNNTPVDSRGDLGVTPLMRASLKGYTEVVTALLDAGADTDAVDLGGASPLHLAVRQGNTDIVQLLLQEDALVDIPDNEGWTPLMRASVAHKTEMLPVLLAKGADPLKVNNWKDNAFTLAIKSNDPATLATLVDSPSFAKLSTSQKAKLQERAEAQKNQQMIALLSPKPTPAQSDTATTAISPKETTKPKKSFFSFFSLFKHKNTKQDAEPLAAPAVKETATKDAIKEESKKEPEVAPVVTPAKTEKPAPTPPPVVPPVAKEERPAPIVTPAPRPAAPAPAQDTTRIAVGEAIRVPVSSNNTPAAPRRVAVRVATGYAPSDSRPLKDTRWLQAGPYTNEEEALAAYDEIKTNYAANGLRVRVISSLQRSTTDVSLRLGPTSHNNATLLCAMLKKKTPDVSCQIVEDFGKSTTAGTTAGGYDTYVHPENRTNPVLTHTGAYWLQFGTYASEEIAVDTRERLKSTQEPLTANMVFSISAPDGSSGRRASYRLRGGVFASRKEATTFCQMFEQHGVRCIVVGG